METQHIHVKKEASEKRILLIENAKYSELAAALAQEGCHVVHCDSVQKAWSLVYPQRPHLIVMRLNNPNGAALAALQECRALAEGVPIVLMTSAHVTRLSCTICRMEPRPLLRIHQRRKASEKRSMVWRY